MKNTSISLALRHKGTRFVQPIKHLLNWCYILVGRTHEPYSLTTMWLRLPLCNFWSLLKLNNDNSLKITFLSCYFTKKRPSKICEIEKINRQTPYKNGLILTKQTAFLVRTLIYRSCKHVLEVLFTCFRSIKACKLQAYLNALVAKKW